MSKEQDQLAEFLKSVDRTLFDNTPFQNRVVKPWGYEIHWVPEGLPYMGKILHINKGTRISLQVHDQKKESWFLMNGRAKIIWEDQQGQMKETEMELFLGYTCNLGQKHRLAGITNCDIVEVSTPEIGNTYRLEDDYSRPTETEEMRRDPNRGWK